MKKILLLLLIGIINLNAYEYRITNDFKNYQSFYVNPDNILKYRIVYQSGSFLDQVAESVFYTVLGIRIGSLGFISKDEFNNYYKNDMNLLNDLYVQQTQPFLNYLYNDSGFSNSNHVIYDNYKILYDSNGSAVESLVDGVYAGLYNMDEMQFSGNLYNENGDLVLVNGFEPSYFQVLCDELIGDLHLKMLDAENLIDKGWIFAVAFTLAIFYLIARTLKRVLIGKNNKGVENES